jgi:hypothetical protein
MHKKIFYIGIIVSFLCLSCNDWLDVKPRTRVDQNDFFTKEKGFKDALTGCYIQLNGTNLYGLRMTITDLEYLAQHWVLNGTRHEGPIELRDFNYAGDYPRNAIKSIYGALYNVIANANSLLAALDEHGDVINSGDVRGVIKAEALAIRAFCHFDALRLFGQMPRNGTRRVALPYALEVTRDLILYYSFEQFTALLLQDLDAAEELFALHDPVMQYNLEELDMTNLMAPIQLDDDYFAFRRCHFNYLGVKALKARVYMYMGTDDARAKAHEHATAVIEATDRAGRPAVSLAGGADFARENFTLPSECIVALSNFDLKNTVDGLFSATGLNIESPGRLDGDLFAGRDRSVNNRYLNVWDQTNLEYGYYVRPVITKYRQSSLSFTATQLATQQQEIPLLRLSEMYLIAMETADPVEANALYKTYMLARNEIITTDLTPDQLQAEILAEYRREFFAEGQMFFTYKRLGTAKLLWKGDREVTEDDYIVPLPDTEMNPNIN